MNYRATASLVCFVLGIVATITYADSVSTGKVTVEMQTNAGTIVMSLDADRAPKTVNNFLQYVESKHYDGTVFHRVIENFMIQGGGLDEQLVERKTLAPIPNEASNGLKNDKYTVAMARTADPNSATCQFFINTNNNNFLNRDEAEDGYGYTVFGVVTEGRDVVDAIAKAKTEVHTNPTIKQLLMRDVPAEPIIIQSIRVVGGS